MIILLGLVIICFILGYTHLEIEREQIKKYQDELERQNEILQTKIKSEQEKMKSESIKNIGSVEM